MDYKHAAQQVLDCIGGKDNILSAAHCATRLRLVIADNAKVNKQELENAEGAKGVFEAQGQLHIMGRSGIRAAYATGRGKITLRGRAAIEETKNGRTQIIITEIPYMVNKARLIENMAELVKDKRIEGITGLNDETNRKGMRIVVDISACSPGSGFWR